MRQYNRARHRSVNINTPKIYREKRSWKSVFFRILLLGFILTAGYFLLLSGKFSIKEINVIGNSKVSYNEIKAIADSQINSGSTFSKIFSTNTLFFSKSSLEGAVLSQNLYVADVKVTRKFPSTVNIQIIEREPVIGWQAGQKVYLVDSAGIAIEERDLAQKNEILLPIVIDEKEIVAEVGKPVLGSKFVSFVVALNSQFKQKTGLAIAQYSISESTFDLKATTDTGLFVLFDTMRKPDTQVDNVKRAIDHANNAKKKLNEYVDVRISGKIFYK